jgi:hypothetical protein
MARIVPHRAPTASIELLEQLASARMATTVIRRRCGCQRRCRRLRLCWSEPERLDAGFLIGGCKEPFACSSAGDHTPQLMASRVTGVEAVTPAASV